MTDEAVVEFMRLQAARMRLEAEQLDERWARVARNAARFFTDSADQLEAGASVEDLPPLARQTAGIVEEWFVDGGEDR